MNKIMLAMALAGIAASAQAAPSLISDAADAATTLSVNNKVTVSNTLTPVDLVAGNSIIRAPVAIGALSADDGLAHGYAVTFPDDQIIKTGAIVRATVSGLNNPDNKMTIELGDSSDAMNLPAPTEINGKEYLILKNTGATLVTYGVYTGLKSQDIKADTYNIKTQAYIYSE